MATRSTRTPKSSKSASAGKFAVDASMRIIVLVGKEPFLIASRTQEIIDSLTAKFGEIERFSYDGDPKSPRAAQLADVLDELRSYGLIQRHKLVILDNAEQFLAADDRRRPAMEAYASSPVEDATLLMRAEMWRAGNLDKAIAKVGGIFKIEAVNEGQAIAWSIKRCEKRYEAALERDAAAQLVSLVGTDLGRLDMELAKLASFVGSQGTITKREIEEMVGLSREDEVWSIQSPIAAGNGGGAIARMRELMALSRTPDSTRILIAWSICDLMRKIHAASHLLRQGVQPFQAAKQIRLWGDSQRAVLEAARRAEPAMLARLFSEATSADADSKSGRGGDPMRSLEALTLRIADTLRLGR